MSKKSIKTVVIKANPGEAFEAFIQQLSPGEKKRLGVPSGSYCFKLSIKGSVATEERPDSRYLEGRLTPCAGNNCPHCAEKQ